MTQPFSFHNFELIVKNGSMLNTEIDGNVSTLNTYRSNLNPLIFKFNSINSDLYNKYKGSSIWLPQDLLYKQLPLVLDDVS
jgi:hypothetical protein